MLLPFTVQQCQMQLAGIQAQNFNYVAWIKSLLHFQYLLKYLTFTFLIEHSALKRIYCSRKPAKTIRIQKYFGRNFRFFFRFSTYISQTHVRVWLSFALFLQTTMMKSQYFISRILHYSITTLTWHSWMLSASLTITRIRAYVHRILFQLQGHRWNCRKLQSLLYLNQAQTGLVQLPRQVFFEIHLLYWLGKGQRPCHH